MRKPWGAAPIAEARTPMTTQPVETAPKRARSMADGRRARRRDQRGRAPEVDPPACAGSAVATMTSTGASRSRTWRRGTGELPIVQGAPLRLLCCVHRQVGISDELLS